ncbi:DUF262 domain-containing HNH endonuclease family protein [Flavobacterium sp.]|uniref:DUF262 domain-containing protein n=1 Tax=Flavobacterium sp. TaxID=239 RepID=UPI00260462FB|nr:DUF262 domain-containing HNH endonuclease family protein [Flavobacterium sp.]
MDLNAYTRTISTLFSTNVKYVVPRFQREYSWTKDEVSELWHDVINNLNIKDDKIVNLEYFIGSLVLIGEDKSSEMLIVDGQQRLTTITILLSALVETFKSIGQNDFAQGIYSTYIEGKDVRFKPFFKLENENPAPFLQESIQHISKKENQPQNKEEKTLWDSYLYFINKLKLENLKKDIKFWNDIPGSIDQKQLAILEAVRDEILLNLKVIYITVANEDDAYMIFETLNARGKNLSSVDLIKNDLFKVLNSTHPDDTAKRNWKQIQLNLSSRATKINFETFFRHFWLSKYNFVTESKIYKNFKIESNKDSFNHYDFIVDLGKEADIYNLIANPLKTDWPDQNDATVFNSLNALSLFQITQIRTFILALIKKRVDRLINHSDFCKILNEMEKFHFKYSGISSLKMNIFEGKYSKTARDIRKATTKQQSKEVIDQLLSFYKEKEPSFDSFKQKFSELKFTNQYTRDKKLIQYVFSKIENSYRQTDELSINKISLEHIDPQTNANGNYGWLGNLLPIDKQLNEQCGNKSFIDKLPIYEQSDLKVVNEFLKKHKSKINWDETNQNDWFDFLADVAYNQTWKLEM